MLTKPTFFALILASFSAGCAVGPDYVRPETKMADHYRGQAAVNDRNANVGAYLASWWNGFGDPKMAKFVELAVKQNLDLAQASTRILQARAGLGMADSTLLPYGSVSGQAARAHQSVETPLGKVLNSTPGFNRYGDAYELNTGISWEMDLFGGLRRNREAAVADYQASEAAAVATRLAVAAQTADIYISIRGLQSRLTIARQLVQTQQDIFAIVTLLFNKGLATEIQVQQADAALAQARASIPIIENALDVAMNAMDVLLGELPGTYRSELEVIGDIPLAPRISDAGSPRELLRRRPDLIVAERRLAASNARIGMAIAEYFPKLSLSGLVGSATSVSGGNLFSNGASQSSVAFGLRWRLFDFGRINAQIDHAKAQEAEALIAYKLAVLRATEEVENTYSAVVKFEEQAAVLNQGVNALSRARDASLVAYQKGVVSLMDVLKSDENILRASDSRVQAQTESARAAVSAFRALGGGWRNV